MKSQVLLSTLVLFSAFAAAFTLGCASPRTEMSQEEKVHRVVFRHSEPQAFQKVELALAENYRDLQRVLQLRQPESGTFLLKPAVRYSLFGNQRYADYSLKIRVEPDRLAMEFDLGGDTEYGYFPQAKEIPNIKKRFDDLAAAIAQAVHGEK